MKNARRAEIAAAVDSAVAALRKVGTRRGREGMARFAVRSQNVLGVSVESIRALARRIGHDHAVALALWRTNIHEARVLTAFVDEPARVTQRQMDQWSGDFDNWAVCDALCFHLFDRTPHAWLKVRRWSDDEREFVRRAAFALLASLALHDKRAPDKLFFDSLGLIERAASDNRNFVKKAVNWALRGIGKRNRSLNAAALKVAERLSISKEPARRWVGKDALKELTSPAVQQRLRG